MYRTGLCLSVRKNQPIRTKPQQMTGREAALTEAVDSWRFSLQLKRWGIGRICGSLGGLRRHNRTIQLKLQKGQRSKRQRIWRKPGSLFLSAVMWIYKWKEHKILDLWHWFSRPVYLLRAASSRSLCKEYKTYIASLPHGMALQFQAIREQTLHATAMQKAKSWGGSRVWKGGWTRLCNCREARRRPTSRTLQIHQVTIISIKRKARS